MYDDKISNNIIQDLESKTTSIVNAIVVLASQGYIVNKAKHAKLNMSSMLIHAFENIQVFDKEQQHKLERLYNKFNEL